MIGETVEGRADGNGLGNWGFYIIPFGHGRHTRPYWALDAPLAALLAALRGWLGPDIALVRSDRSAAAPFPDRLQLLGAGG